METYPKYLNVYKITQAYGGPQEGGWWFDVGEPLESVCVDDEAQHFQALNVLRSRYELSHEGKYVPNDPDCLELERVRGRTSAAGGYDVEIYEEDYFAKPFPQEKPTYE